MADEPTGYAHPGYTASLGEFGALLPLPRSGGHLLRRLIDGGELEDAMGPYPLLFCTDWSGLAEDLAELSGALVSVSAVADPLGDYDETTLRAAFPDLVRPYKEHFTVDLTADWRSAVGPHHRRNLASAKRAMAVAHSTRPDDWLNDWNRLYGNLVVRHGIEGIAQFSNRAFELQFAIPGVHVFRAATEGAATGMLMWFAQGRRAYYHLGCYSDEGYRNGASFALFGAAIEWFEQAGFETLVLGAGAGAANDEGDGLSRFKRGWATGTATAWLCGRVLDPAAYARLAGDAPSPDFFPAYRRWNGIAAKTPAE
jgi:hypothetical protein